MENVKEIRDQNGTPNVNFLFVIYLSAKHTKCRAIIRHKYQMLFDT